MSLLKANGVQFGQSGTATNNLTLSVPSSPDGTIKLARGNSGATTADVVNIDSSGNVGIGTNSASYRLEVKGSSATAGQLSIRDGTGDIVTSGNNAGSLLFQARDSAVRTIAEIDAVHTTTNGTGAAMVFQTRISDVFAERLRINSSGNLLVGTTNANPSGFSSTSRVVIQADGSGSSALACYASGTTAYNVISIENGNGQVGRIQTNASATSYLTSSDYRLKEDVQPMTGASERILSLKPCTFKWKVDGTAGEGFIAHELQEVCPEAVGGEKDAVNIQGDIEPQGVDQSKIVPLLTAALKEAIAKIETLEAKVTALENK
jgi:hypothetical protein